MSMGGHEMEIPFFLGFLVIVDAITGFSGIAETSLARIVEGVVGVGVVTAVGSAVALNR